MRKDEKYIGFVKWFKNNQTNGYYGFITDYENGSDIFFHKENISKEQSYHDISEDLVVTYNIKELSNNHKSEAINIKSIKYESDWEFLLDTLIGSLSAKKEFKHTSYVQKQLLLCFDIINKCGKGVLTPFYYKFIDFVTSIDSKYLIDKEHIRNILKLGKRIFPDYHHEIETLIKSMIPDELIFDFWINGREIEHISMKILYSKYLLDEDIIQEIILNYCLKNNIEIILVEEIINSIVSIDNDKKAVFFIRKLTPFKEILKQNNKLSDILYNKCHECYKLKFWLNDIIEKIDFNLNKEYIGRLSSEEQQLFLRKLLLFFHIGKLQLLLNDIISIIYLPSIDYSIKILLYLISSLNNAKELYSRQLEIEIYNYILISIKNSNKISNISVFFEKCQGRCLAKENAKNEEGTKYNLYRKTNDRPFFHQICDGRKFINRKTNEVILSKDENLEFWWCENRICFMPSWVLHSSDDWKNYSILDFLSILNIQYDKSLLEICLNLINKINRFLSHMTCRNCNSFLHPTGQSNYAFYGVNQFCCNNTNCKEKEVVIYLSHCLNGGCDAIIDSRNSVKCENGWYICSYCFACCTTKGLEKRRFVHNMVSTNNNGNTIIGHKESKSISCNKCGELFNTGGHSEQYKEILNWFMTKRSKLIYKFGYRSDGKCWFILKKGNISDEKFFYNIKRFRDIGFSTPNLEERKDLQLIAEPFNNKMLVCLKCDNSINLSDDINRQRVIEAFYKQVFH